jgi:hypothetical protein
MHKLKDALGSFSESSVRLARLLKEGATYAGRTSEYREQHFNHSARPHIEEGFFEATSVCTE